MLRLLAEELGVGIGEHVDAVVAIDGAVLNHKLHEPSEPFFVIAHAQIVGRGDLLDLITAGIDVPLAPCADRTCQGKHAAFPARMEHRFVLLILNRAHAMHAAHVVDAVHLWPPAFGTVTLATPIMASRVTSAASRSSLSCSVPAGRSGSTR